MSLRIRKDGRHGGPAQPDCPDVRRREGDVLMFHRDPRSLTDARLQLHWAAQLPGAAADSLLEPAADDSHSNLGWDSEHSRLVGRSGVQLGLVPFEIGSPGGEWLSLEGRRLEDVRRWLEEKIGQPLSFRDYDMPAHGVREGKPFAASADDLAELANWFRLGQQVMQSYGECLVWPHHLDLGWLLEIDGPQASIGGGLSPGDNHFDQPYFYVNPYGARIPETLPDLEIGQWAGNWAGAVCTGQQLVDNGDVQAVATRAGKFFEFSVNLFRNWFAE
jgi:hypothetical protein